MKNGSVSDLFRALISLGTAEAIRQEYEVFRTAGGDYLVFSPSGRGSSPYHMTPVSTGKVEAIAAVMGTGRATASSLMEDPNLEAAFCTDDKGAKRFNVLISLYILAATGGATLFRRSLFFKEAKPTGSEILETGPS